MFAREGARVVGCDINAEGNEETVRRVKEAGGDMVGMAPVDLSDPDQAKAWVDEAAAVHGRIDILYNNAGTLQSAPIEECTVENWRFTIRNEVDVVFFASKFAWPYLKKNGGSIISTASVAGHVGLQGIIPHCTGKGAVLAMSRAMAAEGAAVGIRCNTISPGPIARPERPQPPEYVKASGESTLMKRQGTVEEAAAVALFLASDEASYITGADIAVDGGKGGTRYQPPSPPQA
jgi:NAD(P)-dependent dehydrogenase (short-subunit alcohol dehydrogenase family)